MPKFSFEYLRSLSGSHQDGTQLSTNDRFINLSCNKTQVQTAMPLVNELFPPLCIPSGSRFMVWETSWALIALPNTAAADIIEKRFIEKYDKIDYLVDYFDDFKEDLSKKNLNYFLKSVSKS